MSNLFKLTTGHRGDQFFTTKGGDIIKVWYKKKNCLQDVQGRNIRAKDFWAKFEKKEEENGKDRTK